MFGFLATFIFAHWNADFRLFRVTKTRENENGENGFSERASTYCGGSVSVFRHIQFSRIGVQIFGFFV